MKEAWDYRVTGMLRVEHSSGTDQTSTYVQVLPLAGSDVGADDTVERTIGEVLARVMLGIADEECIWVVQVMHDVVGGLLPFVDADSATIIAHKRAYKSVEPLLHGQRKEAAAEADRLVEQIFGKTDGSEDGGTRRDGR